MKSQAGLLGLLLLASGCLIGPDAATEVIEMDVPVRVTFGYAYDGQGGQISGAHTEQDSLWRSDSRLRIRLDPERDVGIVSIVVHGADSCDGVRWEQFSGSSPHQQGGIARDVTLHGDTGQDDPDYPRVRAKLAAWGSATVFANSVLWSALPEPISTWDAHLMVLDQGIRDMVAIRNSTVGWYDPARPHDGARPSGDDEVHLRLRSQGPAGQGFDLRLPGKVGPLSGVEKADQYEFRTPRAGGGNVVLEVELQPGTSGAASRLEVTIREQDRSVARTTLDNDRRRAVLEFPTTGGEEFIVSTTGTGVGGSYRILASMHVAELVINMFGDAYAPPPLAPRTTPWIPSEETCGLGQARK